MVRHQRLLFIIYLYQQYQNKVISQISKITMIKTAGNILSRSPQNSSSKPNICSQKLQLNNFSRAGHIYRHASQNVMTYKEGSFQQISNNESKMSKNKNDDLKKQQERSNKDKIISSSEEMIGKNWVRFNSQNWKTKINPQVYYYYQKILKSSKSNSSKRIDHFSDLPSEDNTQLSLQTESKISNKNNLMNTDGPTQCMERNNGNKSRAQKKDLAVNQSPKGEKYDEDSKEQKHEKCLKRMQAQLWRVKNIYQEKLTTLQYQNKNLKDELFYLRAAILSKYQTNQAGITQE